MTKQYNDITDAMVDLKIYISIYNGTQLTLNLFPNILENRWDWIVENWIGIKQRMEDTFGIEDSEHLYIQELDTEVKSYKLGNKNNPFENINNFRKYNRLIEVIGFQEIIPTQDELKQQGEVLKEVGEYSIEQLKILSLFFREESAKLAMAIGLGDEDAANILGLAYTDKIREPTLQDMFYMDDLSEIQQLVDGYIFNLQRTQAKPPNLLQIANRNLDPVSGFSINESFVSSTPAPFEISLEHMAKKYLGSSELWYELVTVNNLQPPFVDEVGVKQTILAPASKTSVIISRDYENWIYPGSIIRAGSAKIKEKNIIVESISINDEDSMVLNFNSDNQVGQIKPSENGYIRIYHPHTVRKSSMILIPSEIPVDLGTNKPTPIDDRLRRLERAYINFGFDIYKDDITGDLQVGSNGYFKLAVGNKAIKQAVLNALKTQLGELPFHPNYGVDMNLGERFIGTLQEGELYAQIITTAISRDPRFDSVKILKMQATQSGMSLQISVKIKGYDTVIPLAFVS